MLGLNLAAVLEYYDFALYALLAGAIGQVVFAQTAHPTLNAWLVFVLSYLCRPLGGWLFARVADQKNRRRALLCASFGLAFFTLIVAALPTRWPWLAAGILFVCRLGQGLCWGAEVPLISVWHHEQAKEQAIVRYAWLIAGVGVGALLGGVVCLFLFSHLTSAALLQWGWRVPFLGGALLALWCWWLRHTLPLATISESKTSSLIEKISVKKIMWSMGLQSSVAMMIFWVLSMPVMVQHIPFLTVTSVMLAHMVTAGVAWSCLLLPAVGYMAKRVGVQKMMRIAWMVSILACVCLFAFYFSPNIKMLWLCVFVVESAIACLSPCVLDQLNQAYAHRVRAQGVSLSYNLSYVLASVSSAWALKWQAYHQIGMVLWVVWPALNVCLGVILWCGRKRQGGMYAYNS